MSEGSIVAIVIAAIGVLGSGSGIAALVYKTWASKRVTPRDYESTIREQADYIGVLRAHIYSGGNPPPPPWPEGLTER